MRDIVTITCLPATPVDSINVSVVQVQVNEPYALYSEGDTKVFMAPHLAHYLI